MAERARVTVLPSYGTPTEVRETPVPTPGPDELVVAIRQATVCGTDAHIAQGRFSGSSAPPLVMGHEGCGEVLEAGSERRTDALGRRFREGDLVVWDHPWCGRCPACAIHRQPTLCERSTGYGWGPSPDGALNGTFATHLVVTAASNVLRVPAGLDLAVVSSATCALRTVMHALERVARIRFSDTVVVLGAGAVGLYAAAAAVAAGAHEVVLIGAPASRLAVTDGWGVAERIDVDATTGEERVAAVRGLTAGQGADLVIECADPVAAFAEGLAMVRRGGTFLVLGQADARTAEVDTTALKVNQITVQTSLSATIAHYHQALCFLERHDERFCFDRLVGGPRFSLGEVDRALASVRTGEVLKRRRGRRLW